MSEAAPLRLLAADAADLEVLSAACQDGLFKVADATWTPSRGRFTLRLQRFTWERAGKDGDRARRVWAALAFERVGRVRARHVAQDRPDAFASLLRVRFEPGETAPSGRVTLELAGGGAIELDVECVDALLVDLGEARAAIATPVHD